MSVTEQITQEFEPNKTLPRSTIYGAVMTPLERPITLSLQTQLGKKTWSLQEKPVQSESGQNDLAASLAPDVCSYVIEGPAVSCLAATQELTVPNLQLETINVLSCENCQEIWWNYPVISPFSFCFAKGIISVVFQILSLWCQHALRPDGPTSLRNSELRIFFSRTEKLNISVDGTKLLSVMTVKERTWF